MYFLRMWNVFMKRSVSGDASNSRCEVDTIRPMHPKSRTLPCSWLLVWHIVRFLMSFVRLLRGMGVNLFIVCVQILWGPQLSKLQEVNLAEGEG